MSHAEFLAHCVLPPPEDYLISQRKELSLERQSHLSKVGQWHKGPGSLGRSTSPSLESKSSCRHYLGVGTDVSFTSAQDFGGEVRVPPADLIKAGIQGCSWPTTQPLGSPALCNSQLSLAS